MTVQELGGRRAGQDYPSAMLRGCCRLPSGGSGGSCLACCQASMLGGCCFAQQAPLGNPDIAELLRRMGLDGQPLPLLLS